MSSNQETWPQQIELTQIDRIKRIIEMMGIEGGNPKRNGSTPSRQSRRSNRIIIQLCKSFGILQYLHGHDRQEITFAVSQYSRSIHRHKNMQILLDLRGLEDTYWKLQVKHYFAAYIWDQNWLLCRHGYCRLWNREDHNGESCVKAKLVMSYLFAISLYFGWLVSKMELNSVQCRQNM